MTSEYLEDSSGWWFAGGPGSKKCGFTTCGTSFASGMIYDRNQKGELMAPASEPQFPKRPHLVAARRREA